MMGADGFRDDARRLGAGLLGLRADAFALARGWTAAGEPPGMVRHRLIETMLPDLPALDDPGSLDAREADALLAAADDAIAGRPLGPCPPVYRGEDFMPPGAHPAIAGLMAAHANAALAGGGR